VPNFYSALDNGKWTIFDAQGKKLSQNIYDKVTAHLMNKIGLKNRSNYFELNLESGKISKISFEDFNSFSSNYDE
jgi:hypothetical protein